MASLLMSLLSFPGVGDLILRFVFCAQPAPSAPGGRPALRDAPVLDTEAVYASCRAFMGRYPQNTRNPAPEVIRIHGLIGRLDLICMGGIPDDYFYGAMDELKNALAGMGY